MTREQLSTLFHNTLGNITASSPLWMEFLNTASHNYKYRFDEQVLIFAANPKAKAVLSADDWRRKFNREVSPDRVGIPVLTTDKDTIRTLYDISDTIVTPQSLDVHYFNLQTPDYVSFHLAEEYDEVSSGMEESIGIAVNAWMQEHLPYVMPDLMEALQDTELAQAEEHRVSSIVSSLARDSAVYIALNRCGVHSHHEDYNFEMIQQFHSTAAAAIIGHLSSNAAGTIIRKIIQYDIEASQRKEYNKNKETIEKRKEDEDGSNNRFLRTGEGELHQGIPAGDVHGDDRSGNATRTSSEDGGSGNRPLESTDRIEQRSLWADGRPQGEGFHEMDRVDEQPTRNNARERIERDDLHLNDRGKEAEAADAPASSISQEDIDAVIQRLGGDGKYRLYFYFKEEHSRHEKVSLLKGEYGYGGRSFDYPDGSRGFLSYDGKGIEIRKKTTSELKMRLSWTEVAEKIDALIGKDRYLSPKEIAGIPAYFERQDAAEKRKEQIQFIDSMRDVEPKEKQDTLPQRLTAFLTLLEPYEKRLLEENGLIELRNPTLEQISIFLSRPEKTSDIIDFLSDIQLHTCDVFVSSISWRFKQELNELFPREYSYNIGDRVYIDDAPYEISNIRDGAVRFFDPEFPLMQKEYSKDEFHHALAEDEKNNHLLEIAHSEEQKESDVQKDEPTPKRNTLEHQLFLKLKALAPEILTGESSYIRFTAGEGFMPLTVEQIGENRISVAHTYVQNGDLMADPDMEFVFDLEQETLSARTYQQDGLGLYQSVEDGDGLNLRLEGQLNTFASKWFANIDHQGYIRQKMIVHALDTDLTAFYGDGGKIIRIDRWSQDEQPFDDWMAAVRAYASAHDVKYDLSMGSLGNGITVWNRLHEEHGDFKAIAHISPEGKLTEYEALPGYIREELKATCEKIIKEHGSVTTLKLDSEVPADDSAMSVVENKTVDYRILDDDLGAGTPKERYQNNVAAIRTLKTIESEKRAATHEEQHVMAQYVGWGGLSDAFDSSKESWSSEYAELKALLTDEEYSSARASTLTAFYTPPIVIKAIYTALERMGFQHGKVLDPSCGTGAFFGCMPETMRRSTLHGVEIDSISGRIASLLYPSAHLQIQGFENDDTPGGYFDVAVGNVPFGDLRVMDDQYNHLHFLIHDYFFAKALDKVRHGGIVAFITSKGTLDKADDKVRRYLAQRADLVGAIRLPDNTFKRNAGTDVTSDVIFLQKRETLADIEPSWLSLAENEDGITVNRYFVEHPKMVLGKMVMQSSRFGVESTCKAQGDELSLQLSQAVERLSAKIPARPRTTQMKATQVTEDTLPADPDVKSYSFLIKDNAVYYQDDKEMRRMSLSGMAEKRVRGMIAIRDCVRKLISLQMAECADDVLSQQQAELTRIYDGYTKVYGLLNDAANARVFREDSGYPLLSSLEVLNPDNTLKRKADLFSKRTIKPHKAVTHVDTASEALAVSIGEKACVDLGYMASLLGGEDQIGRIVRDLQGVIFKRPETGPFDFNGTWDEGWVTADEYLSGNVREKLREAKAAAERFPEFRVNVEALERIQPVDLTASEIHVRLGSTWLPDDVVTQFIHELLTPPEPCGERIRAEYSPYTKTWNVIGKNIYAGSIKAMSTYGSQRRNAYRIIEEMLNLRTIHVYDTVMVDGKETRVLNDKETAMAQAKAEKINQAFESWIWKDPDRRHRLCKLYNEKFNSLRMREYDGSHIVFGGMNPEIKLREHQVNAVARIIYGGNTMLAHVVSAGKTFTMIAGAMESKRLGLCHKPLFVVPNHLVNQWANEWLRLYPAANILAATEKDFEKANRKKFCARIATGDYDGVIIGHSQLVKIPLSVERQREMIRIEIQEIVKGIEDAKERDGEHFSVKQMERTKKSLTLRLEQLENKKNKDDVLTFEELGVDRLFLDESHYFKNLFVATKMRNVAGIAQTESQKAYDLYMKGRYLDEITDYRGKVFATGTMLSNSMVELYTLQRYMQYNLLAEMNLLHFDEWASAFGETVTKMEIAPEGSGMRLKTRFAKFVNLPELISMIKQFADIQTADMLKLPVPSVEKETVLVKPSAYQKAMVSALAERAQNVRNRSVEPHVDNMLKITNDGRLLALDQRLADPSLPFDEEGKVAACTEKVFQFWQDGLPQRLTQLVFCDISTPKDKEEPSEFQDVYHELKRLLVSKGVPENEIAFIHEAKTNAKKETLFSKVREGSIRVLLGSTQKLGVGTNAQDKLIALHHLDCPYRPSDLEQRNGRGVRVGNLNKSINILSYVTEGTFDAYLYQMVEAKQRFTAQIFTSSSPVREAADIDQTALDYAEIKALSTGNPLIIERCTLDAEVQKLQMIKSSYLDNKYAMEDTINIHYPQQIQRLHEAIAGFEKDISLASQSSPAKDKQCTIQLEGIPFKDTTEAGKQLFEIKSRMKNPDAMEIGSYRGFKLVMEYKAFDGFYLLLRGALTHPVEMGNDYRNISRLDFVLGRMENDLEDRRERLDEISIKLVDAKKEVEKPFEQEDKLKEKMARLSEIDRELRRMEREEKQQKKENMLER